MQLVAKFDVEQQAQVEIMFNQWLQNGEQAAGYKELQSLHGFQCMDLQPFPSSSYDLICKISHSIHGTGSRKMQPNCLRRV